MSTEYSTCDLTVHERLARGGCTTCLHADEAHDSLEDCFGREAVWEVDQFCPCRGYTGPASHCPLCALDLEPLRDQA